MNRRRNRNRRKYRNYNSTGMKMQVISTVIVIAISILAGYLTATQLLGPALGLESESTFIDFIKEEQQKTEEKKENNDGITVVEDSTGEETESGFALQYGSFSTEKGAEECSDELRLSGIETKIIEKDGMFKVIGTVFDTKEAADKYKTENPQEQDVFITEIP